MFGIFQFSALVLAGFAAAAPAASSGSLTPEQGLNAIYAGLNKTVADTIKLNNSVNLLKPGGGFVNIGVAAIIQGAAIQVNNDVQDLIKTAKRINGKFSSEQDFALAGAIVSIEPTVNSTVLNVVAKKPLFKGLVYGAVDLTTVVKADLKNIRQSILDFSAAIKPLVQDDDAGLVDSITAEVVAVFNVAIAAFSK